LAGTLKIHQVVSPCTKLSGPSVAGLLLSSNSPAANVQPSCKTVAYERESDGTVGPRGPPRRDLG
jgi:hypothetical protein